jgi:periplasmic nitrate reductase NapE
MVHDASKTVASVLTKSDERRAFLVLAVFLAPVMAGVIVGGYGFMVWMFQLLIGPPTG